MKQQAMRLAAIGTVLLGVLLALPAEAAPLSWSSTSTVFLNSSPSVGVNIVSGSAADNLMSSTSTFTVLISSSTGGTFAMTSALDLSVATDTAGGTVAKSCNSSNGLTVTVTQSSASTTYTITPKSVPCTYTGGSSGGVPSGSSGGGGGGGSSIPPPSTPTSTTPAPSSSSGGAQSNAALQAQLDSLLATLQTLMAQATAKGIKLPAGVSGNTMAYGKFFKNLSQGATGAAVKDLQNFLIKQASGPAATRLAKVGANGVFGPATKNALIEFQKKVGIKPASGFFGPTTRKYVNSL